MNYKQIKTILMILLVSLSGIVMISSILIKPVLGYDRTTDHPSATVLLITNNSIDKENALWVSLTIDPKIHVITYLNPAAPDGNATDDFNNIDFTNEIDTVIIDSFLPEGDNLTNLIAYIDGNDTGLIFFGGNYTEVSITQFAPLLPIEFVIPKATLNATLYDFYQNQTGFPGIPNSGYFDYVYNVTKPYETRNNEVQVAVSDEQDALDEEDQSMYVTRVAWQSCPLLYDRILTYNSKTGADTLVEVPNTKEPLVSTWDYTGTRVIYVSPGTADIMILVEKDGEYIYQLDEWNTPFHLWPYFNYFMYMMVFDTANITAFGDAQIETYAIWPYSPIPHEREAIIWMIFVGSLWVFNFVLFFTLGKRKDKRTANAPQPEVKPEVKPENQSTPENASKPEAAKPDDIVKPADENK